jgi:preprotein translocase subunit SecG
MTFWDGFRMLMLFFVGIFMILLVLIQRGKGGGLTGALGGMGGQSAFGTKAGDLFTRITIGAAVVWILLCVWTVRGFTKSDDMFATGAAGIPASTTGGGSDLLPDERKSSTKAGGASEAPAKTETSAGDAGKADAGAKPAGSDAPKGDAPKGDAAPTGDAPKGDAAPAGDAPKK